VDFKDVIRAALDESSGDLRNALEGLTAEERRFQPTPESNHIDFLVWHLARVEDDWLQRFAQRTDTVWQTEGWYERTGLPEKESGVRYSVEQVVGLPRYEIETMLAYYDSVRESTLRYLEGLSHDDLNFCPRPDRRPGKTVAAMFSHVIVEQAQHTGQISYLRGVQWGAGR